MGEALHPVHTNSVVLLKIDLEVDARRGCIRVLNVGWINMAQNYVESLYFTISLRLRAAVKADGCVTKYWDL